MVEERIVSGEMGKVERVLEEVVLKTRLASERVSEFDLCLLVARQTIK